MRLLCCDVSAPVFGGLIFPALLPFPHCQLAAVGQTLATIKTEQAPFLIVLFGMFTTSRTSSVLSSLAFIVCLPAR